MKMTGLGIRKILGLGLAGLMLVALATSGTLAFLSDTETSASNNITAGTLDLVPAISGDYSGNPASYSVTAGGNGINGKVVFGRVLPGQSGYIQWTLSNSGVISGNLTVSCNTTFSENGAVAPESFVAGNNNGSNGDLDEYVLVTLQKGTGTDESSAINNFSYVNGSTPWAVSGLAAVLNAQSTAVAGNTGNDTVVYRLNWSIGSGTGNIIQSDTAEIDIAFTLNQ